MMKKMRIAILACALSAASALPTSLHAQVYVTSQPRAWLGITYDETIIIHNRDRTSAVTISKVAKGSPAEKAGLLVGDTVVKVNDFRANNDVLHSMGASVEPGDTVHLVVRRSGKDRDFAVVVAKRPPEAFTDVTPGGRVFRFDPDSVRGMMRLFVDSMYAGLDTAHMRMFRLDTTAGFHTLTSDSMFFGTMPGTVFKYGMNADSMRRFFPRDMFTDSLMMRLPQGLMSDSMFKFLPRMNDSLFRGIAPFDRLNDIPSGVWEWKSDVNTPDMVFHSITLGQSAFAGAQLANVNADLGEYFGTRTGALVLTVPTGTPAATAGLEAGDIITKVNGKAVTNITDLRRFVEEAKRGESIKLEVTRHQKTKSLELKRD